MLDRRRVRWTNGAPRRAACLAAAVAAWFAAWARPQDDLADEGLRQIAAMEAAFRRAIDRARPSVVSITLRESRFSEQNAGLEPRLFGRRGLGPLETPPAGFGTGIVVHEDGVILTCYHVVRSAVAAGSDLDVVVQTADGAEHQAAVYAADPRSDLATVKLRSERPVKLTPIRIGDGSKLFPGQFVLALGNPFGLAAPDGATSASWGIISNVRRQPAESVYGPTRRPTIEMLGRTLVQTDARLNMGSSGAALINTQGELVGVGMALAAAVGFEAPGGFAQPTDALTRRTIQTLAEGREVEYGLIGIRFEMYQGSQGIQGVTVAKVELPAARQAGLADHDVIIEVNGQPIREAQDLVVLVGSLPPGSKLHTKVMRGSAVKELEIPLSKFRVEEEPIATNKRPEWNGLRVDYLSMLVSAEGVGGSLPDGGVYVREVRAGSPAERAGIRPGQAIVSVNGSTVYDPDQFEETVAKATGPVRLLMSDQTEKVLEASTNGQP
jgi:serine protease Do